MKADLNLITLNVLRSDPLEMIDDFPVRMSRYRVRTVRLHAVKDRAQCGAMFSEVAVIGLPLSSLRPGTYPVVITSFPDQHRAADPRVWHAGVL